MRLRSLLRPLPAGRRGSHRNSLRQRPKRNVTRALRVEPLEGRQLLATFNLVAGVPDGATGSLREAISIANQNAEDDVINLAAGSYRLSLQPTVDDTNAAGDLDLTEIGRTITIRGAGAGNSIIEAINSGRFADRVIHVLPHVDAVIEGVTITGGDVFFSSGGGILNNGNLTLVDSAVTGNQVRDSLWFSAGGGGIHNTGTLHVQNSAVSNNRVIPTYGGWGWSTWFNGRGGGIWNAGTATVTNSIVSGNSVGTSGYLPGKGGGIYNTAALTVGGNTLANNVPDNLFNEGGTVTILGAPSAADDAYAVNEGQTLDVAAPGVLDNDRDPNGEPLTVSLVDGPHHGSLNLREDGSFDYTPGADFNGSDSFTYKANDGASDSNMATVMIQVSAVNDAPVAIDDTYYVAPNDTLSVASPGVWTNDSDADGDPLSAVQTSTPAHGTLAFRSDGGFTYTPQAGFAGADRFTYRVSDGQLDSNVATVTINVATIAVTTTADEDDGFLGGGNGISLREAIRYAPAGVVVDLPAGHYSLTRRGDEENGGVTGDLDLTRNLTLRGAGAATTIIDARPLAYQISNGILSGDRALHVLPGVTAAIRGVTITGGRTDVSVEEYGGGAVLNQGELTIADSVLRDNHTVGFPVVWSVLPTRGEPRQLKGGAVYNTGVLTITGSTIADNSVQERFTSYCGSFCSGVSERVGGEAGGIWSSGQLTLVDTHITGNRSGNGGAIHLTPIGTAVLTRTRISGNSAGLAGFTAGYGGGVTSHAAITIVDSTIADNAAATFGGGLWLQADAVATVTGSTFYGNTADELGGGIHLQNGASLELINSTISGNSATYFGGGIINRNVADDMLSLTNVTVTDNSANSGGGLYLEMASIALHNTMVAGNTGASGGDDISGGFGVGLVRARFSLVQHAGNTFFVPGSQSNVTGVAPRLGPLQNNGGLTLTHALLSGSPAIDAGSNPLAVDAAGDPLATDQRGSNRFAGNTVDMGAVEVEVELVSSSSTKFFVVDGWARDTFEYAADGSLVESYALASSNISPRGTATTPDGATVLVIDNNDFVYVYDADGNSQGAWRANGLLLPEGIATDGNDVWIVDRGTDRIYHFSGAASRRSGDQNAAASFRLASGNWNPKGITSDGEHLWVVNGGRRDEVFKYTVSGKLSGRWTIDSRNFAPTGITIDPSDVNHLWIVDSGTDQVFQYSAAAGRTSGGQSADTIFRLATENRYPQGIADPPVPADPLPAINANVRGPDTPARTSPAESAWRQPLSPRSTLPASHQRMVASPTASTLVTDAWRMPEVPRAPGVDAVRDSVFAAFAQSRSGDEEIGLRYETIDSLVEDSVLSGHLADRDH